MYRRPDPLPLKELSHAQVPWGGGGGGVCLQVSYWSETSITCSINRENLFTSVNDDLIH